MGAVRNPNKPADEQNFAEMTVAAIKEAGRKESLKDSIHSDSDRERQREKSMGFMRRGSSRRSRRRRSIMAGAMGTGSELRGAQDQPVVSALAQLSTHLHPDPHHRTGSFRRRSRSRSRSPSIQPRDSSTAPTTGTGGEATARHRSPTPIGRSSSPQKDHGFAETVTDIVDYVKYETSRKGRARAKLRGGEWESTQLGRSPSRRGSRRKRHRPWTGPQEQERSRSASPDFHNANLTARSRSPSPYPPPNGQTSEYYGTTQLEQRSRSPSPSSAHSLPVQQRSTLSVGLSGTGRTGKRRLLPNTPNKPSFLRLTVQSVENINFPLVSHSPTIPNRSPGAINFPKLNASPTHLTKQQPPQHNWTAAAGNGL
ncbi:unnamed protein product, partial [Oppiella nova]